MVFEGWEVAASRILWRKEKRCWRRLILIAAGGSFRECTGKAEVGRLRGNGSTPRKIRDEQERGEEARSDDIGTGRGAHHPQRAAG